MSRALLLFLLLVGTPLLAAVPTTSAQEAPPTPNPTVLCFDRDPRIAGACATSRPPDYQEGDEIGITIDGAPFATQPWVSVRCVRGCPGTDPSATNVYWARWPGAPLKFPRDFNQSGAPGNGANAVFDRTPRYNATWEVTIELTTPIRRTFHTWLYDAMIDANHTVRPGAQHQLRASGFDAGAEVSYRWERKDPFTGRYEPFRAGTGRAGEHGSRAGWFEDTFALPKSEAQRIVACDRSVFDCYRVVVSGAGKSEETVNVQVGVAHVKRNVDTTPGQTLGQRPLLERTQNASFDIDLVYPGGRLRNGPKLVPEDVPESAILGGRALRVLVERSYPNNDTVYLLGETALRYDATKSVWNAIWTIPKDLEIESSAIYRLRLPEQRDVYGNRIIEETLGNFSVSAAILVPRVTESWRDIERTEKGVLRVVVNYHNQTPFTPDDARVGNESPLSGCFVRLPSPAAPGAPPQPELATCSGPNTTRVWGRYYDGAWNFSVQYPRDYPHLNEAHRFYMENGTNDRWGNGIWDAFTPTYVVAPARPTVNVTTVMRGEDSTILERGSRVHVSATITYHDGTPFNHHVRPNPNSTAATVLEGRLIRRGPAPAGQYGPIAGEEPFNLTETDPSAGRWAGTLQLTDDDTSTPVGIWTFKFDIADNVTVPNANQTAFDREIVSSIIVTCPSYQPHERITTGSVQRFRFRLLYSACDGGREVAPAALEGRLSARVFAFNPQNMSRFGPPISNQIIPQYSAATSDWGLEYEVPTRLYTGWYVFALSGADTYGNKLLPQARSRPWSTYTDIIFRAALTQPPAEVRRGDSATVVFDAREGDTGVDPNALPRIQLERFDTSRQDCQTGPREGGCWARERADVRLFDPTLSDHVGVFPVSVDTPVGLYRFALQGRDADFRVITAISQNFTVNPTLVSRALVHTPPERVIKGEPFSFHVDHAPGDVVRERVVFHNGRVITLPLPVLTVESGTLNVTFAIPFEAPTGNYTIRLQGRDVNGNVISVISPPIEASAAELTGRLLGQPVRVTQRGEEARIQFGITYPDGAFYAATDSPRVIVVDAARATVAQATVRREGLTFAATWTPGDETPLAEYRFQVIPQATSATGNLFPPLESQPFRVAPGSVFRLPTNELGEDVERLSTAIYGVPFRADDKFVGFELVYYGPGLTGIVDPTAALVEVTRSPLPHTIDAANGRYIASLVTDHQTQTGTFKIAMTGEDAHGNRIESESRPFILRPTTVGISWDPFPDSDAFGEGKSITLSFTATYRVGVVMDDTYGRPSVVALYNGRPITQRPEVEFSEGHWFMTWTAPDILPDGEYQFAIGGTDLQGNPIATSRSTPYIIQTAVSESFAKAVPGPGPILLALAVVAGALLARRRRAAE